MGSQVLLSFLHSLWVALFENSSARLLVSDLIKPFFSFTAWCRKRAIFAAVALKSSQAAGRHHSASIFVFLDRSCLSPKKNSKYAGIQGRPVNILWEIKWAVNLPVPVFRWAFPIAVMTIHANLKGKF